MGDIWPCGPARYTNYQQCYDAMISLGFDKADATIMAAIGGSEAAYDLAVINDTPATGDYSVGVWQVNYYDGLYDGRVAEFGTPCHLANSDVTTQAKAARTIWAAQGFGAWGSYNNGDYRAFLPGGSAAPGPSGEPTLEEGDTGAAVQTLQTDLNITGAHLTVDGDFGPLTLAAVEAFQRKHRLTVDGIVGPKTWRVLNRAAGISTSSPTPAPGSGGAVAPNQPASGIDGRVQAAWTLLGNRTGALAVGQLKQMSAIQDEMRNHRR